MHTTRTTFKLMAVLIAIVIWLAMACREETQLQDEAACVNRIERDIARRVEEMRFLPIPQDVAYCESVECWNDCESVECWNDYKRYRVENELARRVFDKHGDKFWRQRFVFAMGVGRLEDESLLKTGQFTIFIYVREKFPQDFLPPEDVIPDRLECIPIRIEERRSSRSILNDPIFSRVSRWRCITQGRYCDNSWRGNQLVWD